MKKYFYEYLYSKFVLCKLICQLYDYNLSRDEADKLGIEYGEQDIYTPSKEIRCVFHKYNPEALYIWELLGIDKPIVTLKEMWDKTKSIHIEPMDEEKDYFIDSRILKLANLSLFERNYESKMDIKKADKNQIEYDLDIDENDGFINGYEHLFESAGEHVFSLFGFDRYFVPYSKVLKIKKELLNDLLEKEKNKKLILK